MLLITHDLGIVAEVCDCVAVIYAGEMVEYGTLEDILTSTLHPYTRGLFNSPAQQGWTGVAGSRIPELQGPGAWARGAASTPVRGVPLHPRWGKTRPPTTLGEDVSNPGNDPNREG